VHRVDRVAALRHVREAARAYPGSGIVANERVAKLAIVGVGMRSHAGVAVRMFETLAKKGIPVHLVSTSEIKISALVPEELLETGVQALHDAFGLGQTPARGQS
jgi:aspartate kinase